VVVTFDRNTFFNAGVGSAGTDLDELDNRDYARNIFNWLGRPDAPLPLSAGSREVMNDDDLCLVGAHKLGAP
jgi:hypothetical protein